MSKLPLRLWKDPIKHGNNSGSSGEARETQLAQHFEEKMADNKMTKIPSY